MNIQLHQTIKLKPTYCKGKILPEADAMGTCFLVQLIEGYFKIDNQKDVALPIGSKLIILKDGCWKHTQKIKVKGNVVSEQRIVFLAKNIVGTVVDAEPVYEEKSKAERESDNRK